MDDRLTRCLIDIVNAKKFFFQNFSPHPLSFTICKNICMATGESGSLDMMMAMMRDVREDIEKLKQKVFQ